MADIASNNETIKVVIVEDYKLTRVGLRSTLNALGKIQVVGEAEDAFEGLEIIIKMLIECDKTDN